MPAIRSSARSQQGVAIITALLILAIAATIGVSLSKQLQLEVRRTSNIIANEQALVFVSGAEELAKVGLKADFDNNKIDHNDEEWAKPQSFPFEGGTLNARLTGLQSCFNLNNLVNTSVDPVARDRFRRLLSALALNPGLADAVIDWIDIDSETSFPDGAEDGYYLNLPKPYRPANQPMQSSSELRLVKGFEDPRVYHTLVPFVCAFGARSSINVNTAPAEVLISLAPNMTQTLAENIVQQRADKATGSTTYYDSVADMITRNSLSTVITNTDRLGVTTDYFLLSTEVIVGQSRVQVYSILFRNPNGDTIVLRHSIGAY